MKQNALSGRIRLPEAVKNIIETIEAAGYEAYAVGGCVRDCLLGRSPDDWDITTSAKPQVIKGLFRRTVDTGIKHGTVTIMMGAAGYEVTTYRIDGEYEDNRHPKEITYTANLVEDLKRRDFTINAMAYNESQGLIDVFDGIGDMQKEILCCVGNPIERFTEDALRIMRAVRFSAQLGYTIEEKTRAALTTLSPYLAHISAERIQTELVKLITSAHPDYLRVAYETGITTVILPELDSCMKTEQHNPHHCYTVGEHTLRTMAAIAPDRVLRLTMLFHDMGKAVTRTTDETGTDHFYGHVEQSEKMAGAILHRLKFDNDTIRKVSILVRYHDMQVEASFRAVRRAVNKVGEELFPLLFQVKAADLAGQSAYEKEAKQAKLEEVRNIYDQIIRQSQCVSLKTLAVTGRDLIDAGFAPGRELGVILQELLELVLEDPKHNTKEYLIEQANQIHR